MADLSDLRIDHPPPARPRTGGRLAVAALIAATLLAAGGAVWFLQSGTQDTNRNAANEASDSTAANANDPRPSPKPNAAFTAAGYVEAIPPGPRVISPLLPGILQDIHIKEGHAVRAGDLVATLDTSMIEQELARSEAEIDVLRARLARLEAGYLPEEIAAAEARLTAAAATLTIAEASLENHRELAKTGVVPQRTVLDAEARVVDAVRALAEAEADLVTKQRGARPEDLNIARAELARAMADQRHIEWKLQRCTIIAPTDGVVFQQLAQPGQWLAADSAIVTVFDPTALQAWVDVNQRDLDRIRVGQRVTIIADAAPGSTIDGRVIQFMPRASIERNTVRIKISIEGEHNYLRPDMSLRVTFHEH